MFHTVILPRITLVFLPVFLLVSLLIFSLVVLSSATAEIRHFHVFYAAGVDPEIKRSVTQALMQVQSGGQVRVSEYQSNQPVQNQPALMRTLDSPSDGVMVVLDGANGRGEAAKKNAGSAVNLNTFFQHAERLAIPVSLVGWRDDFPEQVMVNPSLVTMFGVKRASLSALVIDQLQAIGTRDVLCVGTYQPEYAKEKSAAGVLCDHLESLFSGNMAERLLSPKDTDSERWAVIISAMTRNPNINTLVVSDAASLQAVEGVLNLINADPVLIGVASDPYSFQALADQRLKMIVDPQWYLQATLAMQVLRVKADTGQWVYMRQEIMPQLLQ